MSNFGVEPLPENFEAESAVLGACLLSESAMQRACTSLTPDAFAEPKHRIIFRGMVALSHHETPVDNLTLSKWLRDQGELVRVGGAAYLGELMQSCISTTNIAHHCKLILECAHRRRLLSVMGGLVESLEQDNAPYEEIREIFQREMELQAPDHGEDLLEPASFREDLAILQAEGLPRGVSTGWNSVDECYRVPPGLWTVVTGIPGMGKTSVVNHLLVNLMEQHGWRFLVFSAENLPYSKYLSRLISLYLGKPFFHGPSQRLSREDLAYGLDFLQAHLRFVDASRNVSLDEILAKAEALHRRQPLNGIVIDPWNELTQDSSGRKTETELIGEQLTRFRRFCRTHDVHGWIIAHPAKMPRNKETGRYEVPTAYDISGSAHWRNKADFVLSVHRDVTDRGAPTKVLVQKVRFQEHGQLGSVELRLDTVTGRLHDTL